MKHLLDVNVLLAGILKLHPHHVKVASWLVGKETALCPMCELGFIRISTNSRLPGMGLDMAKARESLEKFAAERNVDRIPDDLPALDSHPAASGEVTDHYLADLAAKHGFKLATLDGQLSHPAVELVS